MLVNKRDKTIRLLPQILLKTAFQVRLVPKKPKRHTVVDGGADEKRNSSKPLYFRPFFSSAGAIGAVI